MTWLFSLVAGWGVPAKAVKIVSITMLIGLLMIVLGTAKCAYDRSIIKNHDAAINLDAAIKDRAADQASAVQQHKDETRLTQEAGQLEKVQTNAKSDADRRLAKHRCLRLQQAARANGLEPPACV